MFLEPCCMKGIECEMGIGKFVIFERVCILFGLHLNRWIIYDSIFARSARCCGCCNVAQRLDCNSGLNRSKYHYELGPNFPSMSNILNVLCFLSLAASVRFNVTPMLQILFFYKRSDWLLSVFVNSTLDSSAHTIESNDSCGRAEENRNVSAVSPMILGLANSN